MSCGQDAYRYRYHCVPDGRGFPVFWQLFPDSQMQVHVQSNDWCDYKLLQLLYTLYRYCNA
jgi:hypothetical protein